MQQVLFRLPIGEDGIPIHGFGAMLFCAFVACIWLATQRARKVGIAPEVVQDLALWIFGGGILGARITFILVFAQPPNVGQFFLNLIAIWDGGIILYGGVIGALISYTIGYYVSLRHKENVTTLRLADIIAPTIAVGLILGRTGCFLNGCCYGQVACGGVPTVHFPMSAPPRGELTRAGLQTTAGFLVKVGKDDAVVSHVEAGSAVATAGLRVGDVIVAVNGRKKPAEWEENSELPDSVVLEQMLVKQWPRGVNDLTLTVRRGDEELTLPTCQPRTLGLQPTQLYESFSMVLVLLLLLAFDRVKTRDGQSIALMMMCYGVHRFVNEKLRIDSRPEGFESYISVLLVVAGAALMVWVSRRPQEPLAVEASGGKLSTV